MLAILLTVIGIFFVFYESFIMTTANLNVLGGDVLLVMAVLTFSTYVSFGKEFIAKYGALKVITAVFISGVIFYIPLFIYDLPRLTLYNLTYKGIISFFFLAFVVAYLAYLTWYQILKTIAVSKITTLSNLSPLITVIFSVIFLSENLSIYLALGGIITIGGVFIMHRVSLELT
jgi:drug/metabolite transporter (DMT)-like permease